MKSGATPHGGHKPYLLDVVVVSEGWNDKDDYEIQILLVKGRAMIYTLHSVTLN
jgi:hypothetical protein